ncbi:hypothetical protein [Lactiplantibacillus pentosus]|uniref:hypothetical protein n=1 Tax=Lactiplantibacillus pentosus TaxID=1589 RepID=UPI001330377B|nr:hypothetical protein [Lactiplantibacillus pentosus]MBQ0837459.1 hypothetical protein [Lactiplantibacillus pentosus]MBU7465154.1 hypothetical protein [Lactiplantibacillus pentosus]MBU7491165.1 hypothetical protein [Lactiplantibacillus pentosus]MBU7493663.1 hypothetical protein [Lactiplantibacillus pentosus]MBU7519741.1 hypothetical protein [Lactiplantibacillus pentosus]
MELTIGLIIGTSLILAVLCGVLSGHYYRQHAKIAGTIWALITLLLVGLAAFFGWVVWFGM